jgi:UDP-N-acetylmuramoylalanine--D-glutamate ligase
VQFVEKKKGNSRIHIFRDTDIPGLDGVIHFNQVELCKRDEFSPSGTHNLKNLGFALIALKDVLERKSIAFDPLKLREGLITFKGLSHRVELVATGRAIRGPSGVNLFGKNLTFINDSKATTVQAVLTALTSYPGKKIRLLVGGRDKESDYSPLATTGATLYPFGEAASIISQHTGEKRTFHNLSSAFESACVEAQEGDMILLSPACTSFDEFTSYAHRGQFFRELVLNCLKP